MNQAATIERSSRRPYWIVSLVMLAAYAGCGGAAATPTGGTATPGGDSSGGGNGNGSAGSGGGGADGGGTPSGNGGTPVATKGNPFAGAQFYVNPDYASEVDSSMAADPADAAQLGKMKSYPTAILARQHRQGRARRPVPRRRRQARGRQRQAGGDGLRHL